MWNMKHYLSNRFAHHAYIGQYMTLKWYNENEMAENQANNQAYMSPVKRSYLTLSKWIEAMFKMNVFK